MSQLERAAAQLLEDAVSAGRLPPAPSPESLARIASVIRPALADRGNKKSAEASNSSTLHTGGHVHGHPAPTG